MVDSVRPMLDEPSSVRVNVSANLAYCVAGVNVNAVDKYNLEGGQQRGTDVAKFRLNTVWVTQLSL